MASEGKARHARAQKRPPSLAELPGEGDQEGVGGIRRHHVVQYRNARIMKGGKISKPDECYLWTYGGKIIDPEKRFWEAARLKRFAADKIVDCQGLILAPGYIDVQLNGAFGVDFTSMVDSCPSSLEGYGTRGGRKRQKERKLEDDRWRNVKKVAHGVLRHGVTAFCPTVITSAPETYSELSGFMRRAPGDREHAAILGMHLEGPFISREKYGAHPKNLVREPTKGYRSAEEVYGSLLPVVDMVTLAPELKGAKEVISGLVTKGIVASCGHTMASLSEAEEGYAAGSRMITHMFNAMAPFHHRDPGLIGMIGKPTDKPYYGIISDGIHAHPNSVRIAYHSHPKGTVLVTDAMGAMGLGEGQYNLGDTNVRINGDRATTKTEKGEVLAGSIATMCDCVRNFRQFAGCSIVEAVEAASLAPALLLGIESKKGSLKYGRDADMVILDNDLNVMATIVGGEWAHVSKVIRFECQ